MTSFLVFSMADFSVFVNVPFINLAPWILDPVNPTPLCLPHIDPYSSHRLGHSLNTSTSEISHSIPDSSSYPSSCHSVIFILSVLHAVEASRL